LQAKSLAAQNGGLHALTPPADPSIYHITHASNLGGIIREGGIWCDHERIARGLATTNIGHNHIKERRRSRCVPTCGGGALGDYVPFNFCPRSVMLFAVHKGHQDYSGGQSDVVHLVSSVNQAIGIGQPWAFTDRHAELAHALYFEDLAALPEVPWAVMTQRYWSEVKEERQAEFLVRKFYPWSAITMVGVMSQEVADGVEALLKNAPIRPVVRVETNWYY